MFRILRVKFPFVHSIIFMVLEHSERTLSHMWAPSVRLYKEPENECHTSPLQRCYIIDAVWYISAKNRYISSGNIAHDGFQVEAFRFSGC